MSMLSRPRAGCSPPRCQSAGGSATSISSDSPRRRPLVARLLDPRRPGGGGAARLGDELLERARLPFVEALGVIGVAQPEQRIVGVVPPLGGRRPQIRADRPPPPLLGRAHPELD